MLLLCRGVEEKEEGGGGDVEFTEASPWLCWGVEEEEGGGGDVEFFLTSYYVRKNKFNKEKKKNDLKYKQKFLIWINY